MAAGLAPDETILVIARALAQFVVMLDASVVNFALPSIPGGFGWVPAAVRPGG